MITNTHKLHSLIRLATESAREEIGKIDFNHLEDILPDETFKPLFDAICTIDETQKVINNAISEIMDGEPESKRPIEIDEIFETEKTVFRLFYMINNEISTWRVQGERK